MILILAVIKNGMTSYECFFPAMFLARVSSPRQGAQCGPADKHLVLCFSIEWANTGVSTEEKKKLLIYKLV
jgi:hypothetical protein